MKICFRFLRTRVELGLILQLAAVVCISGMMACGKSGPSNPDGGLASNFLFVLCRTAKNVMRQKAICIYSDEVGPTGVEARVIFRGL